MSYIWQSIKTLSYWRYAVLSLDGAKTFFAVLGVVWLVFEMLQTFQIIDANKLPLYLLVFLLVVSLFFVVITRRPVNKIKYKLAGKDLSIEVRISDLFDIKGQKIISTNTTFDTDMANGIIAVNSLQGQFATKYFPNNLNVLNNLIQSGIANEPFTNYPKIAGNDKKYAIGTTVRVNQASEVFYLLAMSDLNFDNTAQTTFENVLVAVDAIFEFIKQKGETSDIVIPLVGTGRGRIPTNRKKVIARIAHSFVKASEQQVFSNKLIIAIHPSDAKNFGINLHQVRDLLNNYLP